MGSHDTVMTAFEPELTVNEEVQPSDGSGATRIRSAVEEVMTMAPHTLSSSSRYPL